MSYLSKTTCEEFIHLIASSILDQIICEIKRCKYYSVSLNSTPDISHVDQLTLIVRYVLLSGPVERFVEFLDMEGNTAEQLAQCLLDFLSESGIDIKYCHGQSYDNASIMSGKYIGVQARIKEINNYAEYIPCLAHSLNLVAKCAADCCTEPLLFFDFIENLYTYERKPSASLQSFDQDLNTSYAVYESLYGYVQDMRSTFQILRQEPKI